MENGGLAPLVKLLQDDTDKNVRSKAQYAISGFLKHHQAGVAEFEKLNGFATLHKILKEDADATMTRKVVFLYNTLVFDSDTLATRCVEDGTLSDLEKILVKYTSEAEDEDMVEKSLRTIHTIITKSNTSVSDELNKACEAAKAKFGKENLQLAESEWKDLGA